jgi:phosphoribosylglycinamide formyltransferase-1
MSNRAALPALGIIGSSGGATLAAASDCLKQAGINQPWIVLTDRACGLADWATREAASAETIPYEEPETFSSRARAFFSERGVNRVLLFYTRRVSRPLISTLDVSNIHPSLLPEFPGMGAVRQALTAGSARLGATLHLVDDNLDTGKIVMQASSFLPVNATLQEADRISYLHKIWLTLYWQQNAASSPPQLRNETASAFERLKYQLACNTLIRTGIH